MTPEERHRGQRSGGRCEITTQGSDRRNSPAVLAALGGVVEANKQQFSAAI
jgi:hypothetical protein